MSGLADQKDFSAGDVIFHEGDVGDCAYIVESGRIEIAVSRDGAERCLAEIGAGGLFGEMAIIDGRPRTATARALEPTRLFVVTDGQLRRRMDNTDPVVRVCLEIVLGRFRETLSRLTAADAAQPAAPANREADMSGALAEMRLERDLERALHDGQLSLYFQPIVTLATGAIAGFEALMRWHHPTRGLVPPDEFIPAAEHSGLIVPMTEWAFRTACAALPLLDAATGGHARDGAAAFMTVNVSGRNLADDGLVDMVRSVLAETGADPRRLKLEVTESMLMDRPEQAAAALAACRAEGLGVAIDDFGTGYSSLSYLASLPVTCLKIDRSFVHTMQRDAASRTIVRTIAQLGRELDLPIVGEGVERKEEASMLNDIGCAWGQGYLYSRPVPEDETIRLLRGWDSCGITTSARPG
jgi:EAL domain-containing protein (putative c-di-GMP-specific phosphodiesterase class I)